MLSTRTAAVVTVLALSGLAACGNQSGDPAATDTASAPSPAAATTPASPSAEPAAGSLSDPAGDVRVDGKNADPRPDATANTDLTGLSATYDGKQLVVTMTYVDPIDPSAVNDFYSGFVIDPAGGSKVEVVRLQDSRQLDLSDSEDSQGACGSRATDDGTVVTMTIPASCFGSPSAVSVGDAYATSAKQFDGEWVIDRVGTAETRKGPMVEAAPA